MFQFVAFIAGSVNCKKPWIQPVTATLQIKIAQFFCALVATIGFKLRSCINEINLCHFKMTDDFMGTEMPTASLGIHHHSWIPPMCSFEKTLQIYDKCHEWGPLCVRRVLKSHQEYSKTSRCLTSIGRVVALSVLTLYDSVGFEHLFNLLNNISLQ